MYFWIFRWKYPKILWLDFESFWTVYEALAQGACGAVFMVIFPLKIMANWDDEEKKALCSMKIACFLQNELSSYYVKCVARTIG